jgi:hypothetical protein
MKYAFLVLLMIWAVSCKDDNESPLKIGFYGSKDESQNSSLIINENKAVFEFTCGTAYTENISNFRSNGEFASVGIYTKQYGIVPQGHNPENDQINVILYWKIKNEDIEVKILNQTSKEVIGVYNYKFGIDTKIFKCA